MEAYTFKVDGFNGKIRDYLRKQGFSSSLINQVKYDNVYLNGVSVHMRAEVKHGDDIKVFLPEEESENIQPIDIPIEIVYEDEYILAVNKPINMPVHPSRGNSLPTLANAVRAYIGHPFVFRSITRLDRDTSGIVLIAKDRLSASKLSVAMKSGRFKKTYYARVEGAPSPANGTVDAPIRREAEGALKRIVSADGKPSVTQYSVIEPSHDGTSLVKVMPITGRTHQIRVHMAHIGHPLVNDFLYGARTEGETYRLHCAQLEFPHPNSGKTITVTAAAEI